MNSENFQKIGLGLVKKILTMPVVLLLIWIPCVIFIFATIADRKIAGLVAGIGFLTIPIININYERFTKSPKSLKLFRIVFSTVFLLFSAIPIFCLRIFNWEKSLDETSFLGILSGRELHSLSNGLYVLMLVAYIFSNIIESRSKNKNGAF